ncbi:TetR/AcrR family transcriptional regulator [Natrinema sp. CGMCC1.2065]|uniref:TetR/AcrR family transcriptional regulator n=1 Tax=Natrinema sp. CGMCC1.2065 TaxID=3445767 RepID=UPI003F49EA9C
MAATTRSLREHGYADLTIEKIGDEFEKSQSLIYHHYDGKDDLVIATLEFVLDRYSEQVTAQSVEDPKHSLETVVTQFVDDDWESRLAATLFELRAQAIHDEAYREHFTRSDDVFEQYLADLIADGIERGVFKECDPNATAATLVTLINGATVRRASTRDDAWLEGVRSEIDAYLEARVYRDEE